MSTHRIGGGGINTANPFGPQWLTTKGTEARTLGQQVQQALFGRQKPAILDPARFPALAGQIVLLNRYRKKLATMAGDEEDDYSILLADDTIASIDDQGNIFMGAEFLETHRDQEEVLVGVLSHEIGHRPKRWKRYQMLRDLAQAELEAICREEEAKADTFAGMALAEMGLDCDPLIAFLHEIEDGPHPEYFSADIREQIVRNAYAYRKNHAELRRKMFPGFDRMTSPKNHLGDF